MGAKEYNKLISLSNSLIKYGNGIGVIIAILGALFYYPIGKIFIKEPEVLEQFYSVFWIVLAMQPLCALAFIFDGMFKGLGKMADLRNLLLLSTFLIFLPTLYFLDQYNLKLTGIFIALTLWIAVRGLPLIIKFRKEFLPLSQKN
jgi:Na+-driven multidrug efflux pump